MGETTYTLDGKRIEDLGGFFVDNMFDDETQDRILSLEPGESMLLGGGAGAEFTLRREN